jgi:hypothetical protein
MDDDSEWPTNGRPERRYAWEPVLSRANQKLAVSVPCIENVQLGTSTGKKDRSEG